MTSERPHPWEKSYPSGVRWDAPIETTTLPDMLDAAVSACGERPALEYRDRRLAYRELAAMVEAAAGGLGRLGIGPGSHVALYLPNTPFHPIALFGVLKAGGRVVHLSPLDAERELAYKLRDSGARTVVTANTGGLLPMATKLAAAGLIDRLIVGDDAAWGPPRTATAPIAADDDRVISFARLLEPDPTAMNWQPPRLFVDDVALLQYTGGTTGIPKAAMLTHANLTATVSIYETWNAGQNLSRPGEERVICALPLFHIYGLTTVLLRHLRNGNEILLRPRFDVESILRDIEVKRATHFTGVPTMWIAFTSYPDIERRDLSSLRQCNCGGAPLPLEVAQRFERLTGLRLRGGWGMTETSPAGTQLPHGVAYKAGSIGLPLPGIRVDAVALDDPRRILKPGETGELRIKGPNVTKGYWNRADETAAAFVDGYLLTGDVGYMDEDGFFYLVDRRKDMIISGGFNVYPRVIEEAMYEHPDVEEAIVIGVPDAYHGEAAKAYVKLRAGARELTLGQLHAFLADKVGRHEMPLALELRQSLPRTSVGKLSKRALLEEERSKGDAAGLIEIE